MSTDIKRWMEPLDAKGTTTILAEIRKPDALRDVATWLAARSVNST